MRKALSLLLILVLCVFSLSAYVRVGGTFTTEKKDSDGASGERTTFDLGAGTYWSDELFSVSGPHFSFISEVAAGASFDEFHADQSFHLDLCATLLPGFTYVFNPRTGAGVSASVGIRAVRLGFHGSYDNAGNWDKFIHLISFGILGSTPHRYLETVIDVRAKFGFFGAGMQVSFPITGKSFGGYSNMMSASVFVTLGQY